MVTLFCFQCETRFLARPSHIGRAKYCSRSCLGKSKIGKRNSNWRGGLRFFSCRHCKKRLPITGYQKKRVYCGRACRAQHLWAGKKHWNWKGGVTPEIQKIRTHRRYRKWARLVKRRDGYRCMMCGIKSSGKRLIAHHIRIWACYPKLRFDLSNGLTLCRKCHLGLHNRNRKIRDFRKILNDYMPRSVKADKI